MTKEEAITMIKALIGTYITCHGEEDTIAVPLDNIDIEAFDMAVKALEQEPILDKIRDEINEHIEYNKKMNYMGIVSGLLLAKNVLDKHKSESEPEDGEEE